MEEILRTLVEFYPVSSEQSHVKKLLDYCMNYAGKRGMESSMLTYNGFHNAYISNTGSKHSRILLQAHIDVVPGERQPYEKVGDTYFGRGVYDMLFATACYMQLIDELAAEIHDLDLAIMLSGDEELGGFNGVHKFLSDGYTTDVCILPDAGGSFGTLNVAAKGIYNCNIRIEGTAHHGSRPWEGDGAAAKLVAFLHEAEMIFDTSKRENSTMTIAKLEAGDADNKGPSFADATLDIRFKDTADLVRIKKQLGELLEKYNGSITSLTHGENYQLDDSHHDVAAFVKLYRKHYGKQIKYTKAHGSSDARFFTEYNTPVIMLRPDGGGAHGDKEWISAKSIDKFYQLLKEYVIKVATIGE